MATSPNDAMVAKLITAPIQKERISDLKDSDFIFNFLNAPHSTQGQDGFITIVNPSNFPALLTGNGAIGIGIIGPCGLNTPHVHPRASEVQINLGGGDLESEFIQENGGRVVKNTMSPGMATVFPKGGIHFQQNLGCEPVTFISSFDFVDPGVSQVVTNLFMLDKEVISATFNDIGLETVNKMVIPPNIALGTQSCFDRCNIDRSLFKFNGTFADFFDSTKHLTELSSSCPYNTVLGNRNAQTSSGIARQSFWPGNNVPFSQNPLRSSVLGLSVTLVAVVIFAVFVTLTTKRHQLKEYNIRFLRTASTNMVGVTYSDAATDVENV